MKLLNKKSTYRKEVGIWTWYNVDGTIQEVEEY